MDQTFGQHLGVKLLENVFVLDVLEHNHLREETAWSLWFHCKTKTSPYREARVTASHHLVQSVLQFSLLWVFGAEKETKTNKNVVLNLIWRLNYRQADAILLFSL